MHTQQIALSKDATWQNVHSNVAKIGEYTQAVAKTQKTFKPRYTYFSWYNDNQSWCGNDHK